mmetsp:Transcript_34743/g.45939  ORF Transcript_34743/g.45939 Transcript_34743/m.45939 type:complete len:114 (-) Transcript_34743:299-640(-)
MGRIFKRYLDGPQIYTCIDCGAHLSCNEKIVSRSFHGRGGRAYLFDTAINLTYGPLEQRHLITGLHIVCDIYCIVCHNLVGWKYEEAFEESQKYKVGKFILEKTKLAKDKNWT